MAPQTAHSSQRYNTSFTQNTGFFSFTIAYRCNLRTLGDSVFFPVALFFLSFSDVFFPAVPSCCGHGFHCFFGTKNPLLSVSVRPGRAHAGCFLNIFFFLSPSLPGALFIPAARALVRLAGLNFRQFIRLRRGARITKTENRYVNILRDGRRRSRAAEPYAAACGPLPPDGYAAACFT